MNWVEGEDWEFPNALFAVSKEVRREVCEVFYGMNDFSVGLFRRGGLTALSAMGPRAKESETCAMPLRSLKSLSLELNRVGAWTGLSDENEPWSYCATLECETRKKFWLDWEDKECREVVVEWAQMWEIVGPHLSSELKLTITADVKNLEDAERILTALGNLRGPIKQLNINLSADPSRRDLAHLAETISRKYTKPPPIPRPFPFFDLPLELQDRILSLTLLSSASPIIRKPIFAYNDDKYHTNTLFWTPSEDYHPLYSQCCSRCNHAFSTCLCTYGAGASYSQTCNCYSPPTNLFLVSRAFRLQAIRIFFSINKIYLFSGEFAPHDAESPDAKELVLNKFFAQLPKDSPKKGFRPGSKALHALSSLRHIVFPFSVKPLGLGEGADTYKASMAKLVEFLLNGGLRLEGLTLEAQLFQMPYCEDFRTSDYRVESEELEACVRTFGEAFKPLRGRIRNFFCADWTGGIIRLKQSLEQGEDCRAGD